MKNVALRLAVANPGIGKEVSDQERIAGVAVAVTAASASAEALPTLAGSASQARTSGDWSVKIGTGASMLMTYPAAMALPSDSTGDQANQLHHTESGAMNFEYLSQAVAP